MHARGARVLGPRSDAVDTVRSEGETDGHTQNGVRTPGKTRAACLKRGLAGPGMYRARLGTACDDDAPDAPDVVRAPPLAAPLPRYAYDEVVSGPIRAAQPDTHHQYVCYFPNR